MTAKLLGVSIVLAAAFIACRGTTGATASAVDGSTGITDATSASDSPLDSGVDGGITCVRGQMLGGGSTEGGCTLNADLQCSDGNLHHVDCGYCHASQPDSSLEIGICDCDVINLTTEEELSATIPLTTCPVCPSASQAWHMCGWPEPPTWTFGCGGTSGCTAGAQFCAVSEERCGASDSHSTYSCSPLPAPCGTDASPLGCGCLPTADAACSCSDDGVGNLTVTCCLDAQGLDGSSD
jgi:hypothetical protein